MKILIDNGRLSLSGMSYIWLSFGLLSLFTSFIFLDWKYSLLNLPYQFDLRAESRNESIDKKNQFVSFLNIFLDEENEKSLLKYIFSPLYVLVVLFLSILLIPTVFLSVYWNTFITHVTQGNLSQSIFFNSFI